jgi:hypothetical protein
MPGVIMSLQFEGGIVSEIAGFLAGIGIPVRSGDVGEDSFLPGILVRNGGLVIDEGRLLYPGDLLHEAGHLAFAPSAVRPTLNGEIVIPGVIAGVVEVQAMCWSYAACLYLGIDAETVFHEAGYYGRSASLLLSFESGIYIGLPGLEAAGMAYSPQTAAKLGVDPFPAMVRWLVD